MKPAIKYIFTRERVFSSLLGRISSCEEGKKISGCVDQEEYNMKTRKEISSSLYERCWEDYQIIIGDEEENKDFQRKIMEGKEYKVAGNFIYPS